MSPLFSRKKKEKQRESQQEQVEQEEPSNGRESHTPLKSDFTAQTNTILVILNTVKDSLLGLPMAIGHTYTMVNSRATLTAGGDLSLIAVSRTPGTWSLLKRLLLSCLSLCSRPICAGFNLVYRLSKRRSRTLLRKLATKWRSMVIKTA